MTQRIAPNPGTSLQGGAWLGIVTVVITLIGWCSVPLFIKHFSHSIDIWTSNGWRYGFSALLWLPIIIWGWKRRSLPAGLWRSSRLPAVFNSLGQIAFAWAFYHVDPTTATFGLRLQIVFVAVGAYLLFPAERRMLRSPLAWLGIAMVLGGITGTIFGGTERKTAEVFGVLAAALSGLLFAAYGLSVRKFMHGFHPVTAFAAISQYTAAVMVTLMLVLGHNLFGVAAGGEPVWDAGRSALLLGTEQFGLLLLSAIIGIALGHVFYYISIARLGVAVSSGVIQLQPFGVAIGSYFVFGQRLTTIQIATGCIAVCGAVLLLFVQWRVSGMIRRESREAAETDGPMVAGESESQMESGDLDAIPCVQAATEPVAHGRGT